MKHNADVNARDKNWQTPLHLAAANNHMKCAGKLTFTVRVKRADRNKKDFI